MSQYMGVTESEVGFSLKLELPPPPINWQGAARDLGLGSGLVEATPFEVISSAKTPKPS